MASDSSRFELVRLLIRVDQLNALSDFLRGNPYFDQPEVVSSRVLHAVTGDEVVLVIEWADADASKRALSSSVGSAFVEGIGEFLTGPPSIAHYRSDR
ncbi:hypothetical protein QM797_22155 [Rhodococcus sp. IEGM 1381]|uniref:hypothetical protein n=1 Tax=Rhodococcus sp. IEGM 1381 TaxID=3047085 RepID=UPI0024B7EDA6|nr:hypothetical protein [Rhodococcus sp. IEGM 1381]MDI9897431.1 hypothetical protein [Rhodococcus sp. IEGM 1381]